MVEVRVDTMIEEICGECGQWARTHFGFGTCHCGGQMVTEVEFMVAAIPPDELEVGF